jgi:DNA-binding transcriptional MocR family regulator
VARDGFTQVPNFILRDPRLSVGAKVVYAMFLSYAWHNDSCFPGQERLAADIGMSRSRVTEYVAELVAAGLVSVQRRGHPPCYTVSIGPTASPDCPDRSFPHGCGPLPARRFHRHPEPRRRARSRG